MMNSQVISELPRRRFLMLGIGAGALLAAPAIVRASSLMRVKPVQKHLIFADGEMNMTDLEC